MPIFEYKCSSCEEIREVFLRTGGADPEAEFHCAACHAEPPTLKKIVSRPSISFKGAGFYVNDKGERQ